MKSPLLVHACCQGTSSSAQKAETYKECNSEMRRKKCHLESGLCAVVLQKFTSTSLLVPFIILTSIKLHNSLLSFFILTKTKMHKFEEKEIQES